MKNNLSNSYHRTSIKSVTNFLYCGDYYLFLKRSEDKKIDPGKLNGVGGKLEPSEDYLSASIRETEEETGYKVTEKDISFCGIIDFIEGFEHEWITCFFKTKVSNKNIPVGHNTDDGELIWIHKNEVLKSKYDLVDDLYYVFKDIVASKRNFFMTVKLNNDQKIYSLSKGFVKI